VGFDDAKRFGDPWRQDFTASIANGEPDAKMANAEIAQYTNGLSAPTP
jgi:hypothetical protein